MGFTFVVLALSLLSVASGLSAIKNEGISSKDDKTFKYKWLSIDGEILDEVDDPSQYVEISSTLAISDDYEATGCDIVAKMLRNAPPEVFAELTKQGGRLGFFTKEDKTTIFPEYEHMRDRPECEGTCDGDCEDTCTLDGRKFDDLPGLGGIRATSIDDNFMCTEDDPNEWADSIIIHEFTHTIHNYSLLFIDDWWDQIWYAYENARENEIWDLSSKAMSSDQEYFAQGAGAFFNVNHSPNNTGGMNSCGKPEGFCDNEMEARQWIQEKDPDLYIVFSYTFTNYQDHLESGLTICPEG